MEVVKRGLWWFLLPLAGLAQQGSFAPQVGHPGSDAIHRDSVVFRDWAVTCEVQRGYRRIDQPGSGVAVTGHPNYALGKADAPSVVSLGDSGVATLTFNAPFFDGPGPDFAVFENGFLSGEHAFLEFAFVEVSSNGQDFIRFPAVSEIGTATQTSFADVTDASLVHNLAGKYIAGYGVPFDLADLPDTSVLDKSGVTHVRIVDVIGSIDPGIGSTDSQGTLVNDPWPTNFEQSGFDLDAVGIIHSPLPPTGIGEAGDGPSAAAYHWFDLLGTPVEHIPEAMPAGIYLRCKTQRAEACEKVFIP